MKYPISLRESTPYFEKYFLLCADSPDAYVAAFREAQIEATGKRRKDTLIACLITFLALAGWFIGTLHLLILLFVLGAVWSLNHWRGQHEERLLDRTFELALRDKDGPFRDYMWQHRNRPF